jgi:hypothetical protein
VDVLTVTPEVLDTPHLTKKSDGNTSWFNQSPDDCARAAVRALGQQRTTVGSWKNSFYSWLKSWRSQPTRIAKTYKQNSVLLLSRL